MGIVPTIDASGMER